MNSLQRSSFSFRRQGSSGRIWQDQIQFEEAKANGHAGTPRFSSGKNKMKKNKEANVPQIEETIMGRTYQENYEGDTHSNSSPSLSKTQNKVHGSFFSSICGLCISNPSGRD
ncbi:hypothetical protein V8G54_011495 [Vigna mungo]|uniref:Uncharacterized protein n=1 Tax=Vigna mungo TaxID=3915 RepID=A0AAQ3RZN3_VIGMU